MEDINSIISLLKHTNGSNLLITLVGLIGLLCALLLFKGIFLKYGNEYSKKFADKFATFNKIYKVAVVVLLTAISISILYGLISIFKEQQQQIIISNTNSNSVVVNNDNNTNAINGESKVELITERMAIDEAAKNHCFPIIEFIFKNDGGGLAFLNEFTVEVIDEKINARPVLSFRSEINEGNLEIFATNNGYGTAKNCRIVLDNSILDKHFPVKDRTFKGSIASGKDLKILSFDKNKIVTDSEIALDNIYLNINYIDGTKKVLDTCKMTNTQSVFVANNDFRIEYTKRDSLISNNQIGQDDMYCVMLNANKEKQSKTYQLSKRIRAGNISKLQVMIGDEKTKLAKLKFKFKIDKDKIIESKQFDIEISNPMNCKYHEKYYDGEFVENKVRARY